MIALALVAGFVSNVPAQQAPQVPQDKTLPAVEVIGTTPLPGVGQPRDEIAAPVQSATKKDIERSGALDLSDFMNRNLGSVHVNEMQGNPYQMDVSYRGYTHRPFWARRRACLCTWMACA